MKVVALLENNQIRWLNAPLQIKSPVQVILEIPDEAITKPVHQEIVSPSERLAQILGEKFKAVTIDKDDYYHYLAEFNKRKEQC